MTALKLSPKHKKIIQTIREKGYYKPAYSDHEPATKTLLKHGIVEWRGDFGGCLFDRKRQTTNNRLVIYEQNKHFTWYSMAGWSFSSCCI